jgi:hypothetical protein
VAANFFGIKYCLRLQGRNDDEGSLFLQNIGIAYLAGSLTLKMAAIYSSETPINFYLTADVTSQKTLLCPRAPSLKNEPLKER